MDTQVVRLKRTAGEALIAWQAALKSGDAERVGTTEAAFEEAHKAHRTAEDGEQQAGEMLAFEKEYLEPATRAAYGNRRANSEQNSTEAQQECMRAHLRFGRNPDMAIASLVGSGMQSETAVTGLQRAIAAQSQAFVAYITNGTKAIDGERAAVGVLESFGMSDVEVHTLMVGENDRGGFLVPQQRMDEILKDRPGARVMRGLARVVQVTAGLSVIWPTVQSATTEPSIRTSKLPGDQFTTENRDATEETADRLFGEDEIRIWDWGEKAVVVTRRLLSSTRDAEMILLEEMLNTFTADEDKSYILGTGAGEALGCLNDARVTSTASGVAGEMAYETWLDFLYALDAQYADQATLLVKRSTLAELLKMKNPDTDEYVWDSARNPEQIMGYPHAQSDFVPDVTSGNDAALFGDFRWAYVIAESDEFRVLRLDQWKPPKIGFLPIGQIGGKIVRPRGFRRYTIT